MSHANAEAGLLDTSVVIAIENDRDVDYALIPRAQYVSTVTLGELHYGIHAARDPEIRTRRLGTLQSVAGLELLTANAAAAAEWGRMRRRLTEVGRKINVNDLWIAAIALAHDLPVITQGDDFDILHELGGPAVIKV